MNQKNNYLLHVLTISLFSYSSNYTTLTSLFTQNKPAEVRRIQQLTTIADVDHEIDMIKKSAYEEELKELACITDKPHDALKYYIDKERINIKELLKSKNSHITQQHSKDIPSAMYNDLISVLRQEQINPKNITLKYSSDSNAHFLATSQRGLFDSSLSHFSKKPQIRLYATLKDRSRSEQLFTYTHEVQHILLQHGFIKTIAYAYNPNANIDKLCSLQEKEADIHAASKNLSAAQAGMIKNCDKYPFDTINRQEYCKTMEIIYELMKQKEKLAQKESL